MIPRTASHRAESRASDDPVRARHPSDSNNRPPASTASIRSSTDRRSVANRNAESVAVLRNRALRVDTARQLRQAPIRLRAHPTAPGSASNCGNRSNSPANGRSSRLHSADTPRSEARAASQSAFPRSAVASSRFPPPRSARIRALRRVRDPRLRGPRRCPHGQRSAPLRDASVRGSSPDLDDSSSRARARRATPRRHPCGVRR